MALSNWDQLGLNGLGEHVLGLRSDSGASFELYKNWIYLRDPVAWREGCGYTHPTIAMFEHGLLHWAGLTIYAERADRLAIRVWAWSGHKPKPDELFCGLALSGYGYPDGVEYPQEGPAEPDQETTSPDEYAAWQHAYLAWLDNEPEMIWRGIESKDLDELIARTETLINDDVLPDEFRDLPWNEVRRSNQGDRFFAGEFGIEPPLSAPGASERPMLEDALDGLHQGES